METLDLRKQLKYLYSPSAKKVEVVDVPRFQFAMIDGEIEAGFGPGTSPTFQQAMEALYGISYTLKFMAKLRKQDAVDYPVMALEGLWWVEGTHFDITQPGGWKYNLMTSTAPVVLSHSNSREYFASQRNTPDELIKAVAKSGGLIGSVMYPSFVAENPTPTMADYVGHIDYLVQLVGFDHVAVASDYTNQIAMTVAQQKAAYKVMIDSGAWEKKTYPYDVLTYPQGVETPKTLFNLTDALLARGYKNDDIAMIWGGNWVRVIKTVLG